MPLLYGEGHRAFLRLQEEIIKRSNDLSIFFCSTPAEIDAVTQRTRMYLQSAENSESESECDHSALDFDEQMPFPRSQGNQPRNNEEFLAFLEPVIAVFRNFHLSVIDERETMVDKAQRKVSLHWQSTADTDIGPYANEYIFTIRVTEDGKVIDEILEFLDSG